MSVMKGIKLCGECRNYDYKKHRCRIGCIDDSNAQASFYGDCPLPDVVPKSEVIDEFVERLKEQPIKCGLPLFGLSTKDEIEEYFNGIMLQVRDAMDKTVKEMIGGAE